MQRPGVGDHAAAVNLVCGILVAMRLRDRSGRGRYIDVSLLQTGLHILGNDVANALVTRQPAQRHDRSAPLNPLWNSYPVAEGRWLLLVMIDPSPYWSRFCRAIGREDLEEDPRFCDDRLRARNSAGLVEILEPIFAGRRLEDWSQRLDAEGLIWSPVRRLDEVIADPQARAMGYFPELEHSRAGRFESVAPPFRIEGMELGPRKPAPELDADAEAILREAGLRDEEIAKLRS
jgi:crotonobetainyl-CoA:carnitine CoA-transferase CaiB-like acyl-CoA transferase